jgi:hypothetical protein
MVSNRTAGLRSIARGLPQRLAAAGSALCLITAAVLLPQGANAQESTHTVAVLEYLARNGSAAPPAFGQLVSGRIRDQLQVTGKVTVLDDSLVASALSRLGFEVSEVTSLGRASVLADTLGAEAVVFGTYESYGSVLKVTSQLAILGANHLRVVEVAEHMASRSPEDIAAAVASGVVPLVVPPSEGDPTALGPPERTDVTLGARKKPIKWGGWVSLAVAAGAVYGAAVSHQRSEDEWDAYLNALDPDVIRGHYDESNRYLTWRNLSFGLGGTALLSTLYYFYYRDYGATEEWASVVPIPTVDLRGDRVSVALTWRLPGTG